MILVSIFNIYNDDSSQIADLVGLYILNMLTRIKPNQTDLKLRNTDETVTKRRGRQSNMSLGKKTL